MHTKHAGGSPGNFGDNESESGQGESAKNVDRKDTTGQFAGLCLYCEKRNSCTYSKCEGGVWNCDEFKEQD